MVIVWSKGTLVNSDFTSNETILQFDGILPNLTLFTNDFAFFTVYSDSHSGDNNDPKYFEKWYVAVAMFETIGLTGKCCTLSFGDILWILAVTQNLPGHEPDG